MAVREWGSRTAAPPVAPRIPTSSERRLPRLLDGRFLVLVCTVLAALSLLIASSPTFDVWAWLVWGREIDHWTLSTLSGPQFKPLPVAVTALVAPFGSWAPQLWLVVARATGLLALAGGVRLAWRVHGPVAALLAVAGIVTAPLFAGYLMPYGMSEPMLVACLFWAVDQHLLKRYGTVFWLLVAASLLRPEAWPFLLGYALLSLYRRRISLLVLAVGLAIVPLAWFVPEYIGSGDPLRTGQGFVSPGDPRTKAIPGLAVMTRFTHQLLPWIQVGAVIGIAYAVIVRDKLLLALTGIGVAWLVVVSALTQLHKSTGTERYLYVTFGIAALLAGVGWTELGTLAVRLLRRVRVPRPLAAAVVSLVVLALAVPSLLDWKRVFLPMAHEVKHQQGQTEALPVLIERAGGRDKLLACGGHPWVMRFRTTQVAWAMNLRMNQIESWVLPGRPVKSYVGVMLQTKDTLQTPLLPETFFFFQYQQVAEAQSKGGEWIAMSPCMQDWKTPAAS